MLSSPAQALRVLVLDGDHRLALAAVRSLGRRHARIVVATAAPRAPAVASRYCTGGLRCPDPRAEASAHARWLHARLQSHGDDVVVFFEPATAALLHREGLGARSGVALPDLTLLQASTEPQTIAAWATAIGVASRPPTHDAPDALQQDFVLLALLRRGDPIASFVYRLRGTEAEAHLPWFERSPAESAHQPRVRQHGLDLLARQRWHGVAALGFRHDLRRDRFTLLGVHPAWTDGLELAIACGLDMPWLYAQLAAGHPITGPTVYRIGRKRRRMFSPPRAEQAMGPVPMTTLALDSGTDLFFHDPLPHLPTLARAARWIHRRLLHGDARAPRRPRLHVVAGGRQEPGDAANS